VTWNWAHEANFRFQLPLRSALDFQKKNEMRNRKVAYTKERKILSSFQNAYRFVFYT
jgi:hypothetical protein